LTGSGNTVRSQSYSYDLLCNPLSRSDTNTNPSERFTCDALRRLTSTAVNQRVLGGVEPATSAVAQRAKAEGVIRRSGRASSATKLSFQRKPARPPRARKIEICLAPRARSAPRECEVMIE
jgi:YD repeat-containing protein